MIKAYTKTLFRTIKSQAGRFITMTAIVALGIMLITGLGATAPNMRDSVSTYYKDSGVPDIIVKAPMGLSADITDFFESNELIENAEVLTSIDLKDADDKVTRIYYKNLSQQNLNKITLADGAMPKTEFEVLSLRNIPTRTEINVGDTAEINFNGQKINVTVSGLANDPLMFAVAQEPSNYDDLYLDRIFYFDSALASAFFDTDIYVTLKSVKDMGVFSKKYENTVSDTITEFKNTYSDDDNVFYLSLNENMAAVLYKENTQRLDVIALIFPIFFMAVVALVALTTMTRLVEDERTVIGCYKTLGYSNSKIAFRYLLFSGLCGLIGSAIGMISGFRILPVFIYSAYKGLFFLPPLTTGFFYTFGFIASAIMIAILVLVTLNVVIKSVKEKPSNLLRQKPPKSGKKVFLEKIGFIWKHLKFKYKSTVRNVFRYVNHFIMTVVSVAGCTALVLAGLGLYDSINSAEAGALTDSSMFNNMLDSIISIVVLLVVAAGLLSIMVIYNLTNMNIEERKKEIATLKVLGYKNGEVAGYIFREIAILTIIGILFGLPLGYGLLHLVLGYMNTPSLTFSVHLNWYTWFICVGVTILFTVIVDLMLYKKIINVDMNASLKSID